MLNSIRKHGVILAIFALVCTTLIALTHTLTKDKIALQQQQEKLRLLSQLLPTESYDNELLLSCKQIVSREYLGSDDPLTFYTATKRGNTTGYIVEIVAPDGYSGAIRLIVGLNSQGTIHAVRVLSHHETPGLGDKIELKKSTWIHSFAGKSLTPENLTSWAVKKDGGDYDAFTGATITPRAVIRAVKKLLEMQQAHPTWLADAPYCDTSMVD